VTWSKLSRQAGKSELLPSWVKEAVPTGPKLSKTVMDVAKTMTKREFLNEIVFGDCLDLLPRIPDNSVRTIHTSPPYNIARGYEGYHDNLTDEDYLGFIEKVLSECKRVLVPGGPLFWQTGYTSDDEYITPLDHLTLSLFQKLGFRLKDRIIWRYWGGMAFKSKFTNKHETILWWVKPGPAGTKPKFNVFPVREGTKFHDPRNNLFGRNPGNVWEVDRVAFGSNGQTSHIAVFPEEIADRIILATTDEDDLVLDPFSGSGTVCKVAKSRGRKFLGFEISPLYHAESVHRVSRQASGELLSVLSEIVKEHVLAAGESKRLDALGEMLTGILCPLSLKPYEKVIPKAHLAGLCAGREDAVKKADKMALWSDLEELLPPAGSGKTGSDPVGLISLIDRAYGQAYKLHKVYSSAMRFHCAARWVSTLERTLAQGTEGAGWERILTSVARSEHGSYILDSDRITLASPVEGTRIDSLDSASSAAPRGRPVTGTLFR
jgi:adenine-specific DNA-methyltransferase